jgi:histidinol-phosphate/aromatic aminotransferase/cobyric acid decarboxylase-like protein
MTAYGLPACLRITIGDEADMRDTAAALAQFMATGVVRIGA